MKYQPSAEQSDTVWSHLHSGSKWQGNYIKEHDPGTQSQSQRPPNIQHWWRK